MQKKQEYDNLQQSNQERKKQMQNALADDYAKMIKMKQDKNNYEKYLDLQNGRAAIDRALKEQEYINMSNQNKKNMIKEVLTNDKLAHDGQRVATYSDTINVKTQAQRDLELMEIRARQRDHAFSSRYNHFNDFQKKVAQSYSENVRFLYLANSSEKITYLYRQLFCTKYSTNHNI